MFKGLEKVFDIIGEILAVVLVIVFALLILDANFHFLPDTVLNIFTVIKEYGALILIAVVGCEAMSKRNFLFQIISLRWSHSSSSSSSSPERTTISSISSSKNFCKEALSPRGKRLFFCKYGAAYNSRPVF